MNGSERPAMKDIPISGYQEQGPEKEHCDKAVCGGFQNCAKLLRISSPPNGGITNSDIVLPYHDKVIKGAKSTDRKLVIHFDIRNTVLVADSVTKVNVEQALNSFLASVTWGSVDEKSGEWTWYSDTPSLTPPAPQTVTYYKHLERKLVRTPEDRQKLRYKTGDFTQNDIGKIFQPYFDKHMQLLRWSQRTDANTIKHLTMKGKDETLYHYILPSFFKLLFHLAKSGRNFAIVFRTYGLDATNVLTSTAYTINGSHPQFKERLHMNVNSTPGAIHRDSKGGVSLHVRSNNNGDLICQTHCRERDIYDTLSKLEGVSAYKDDFLHWQNNGYHYTAGKPLWIDPNDTSTHHILFDDNIRTYEDDSIVDLRLMHGEEATSLSKSEVGQYEDVFMVQSDLMASIENEDYFINKVTLCEENYSKLLENGIGFAPK